METQYMKRLFLITALAVGSLPCAWAQTGGALKNPSGVATDRSGNVYVADDSVVDHYHGTVRKFSPEGKEQPGFYKGYAVRSIAVAENNDVYFTTSNKGLSVVKVFVARLVNGAYKVHAISSEPSQAAGIAIDTSGAVYVADKMAGAILKFDRDDKPLPAVATRVSAPEGVAIDSKGTVYFTTTGDKQVWKATPQDGGGYELETIVTGGLEDPAGIAVDDTGNL
jgi:sugar lactone lactonase YvrE